MNASNPYASPPSGGDAAPAGSHSLLWLLFSFEGRVPRRHFWAVNVLNLFSLLGLVTIIGAVFRAASLGRGD